MFTPEIISAHNLTNDEYERIKTLLGREPSFTELGIFSVMWSEHCSYKSSRIHLKRLPTKGERVIVPPGENAGVVDVGDGWCVAFKVESHNHPSFIEPFQGAATGVGGILRDVFTMGARPVAAMNSLRFGSLNHPQYGKRNRSLLAGVVDGIAHYGNCLTADERLVVKSGEEIFWTTIGEFCEQFTDGKSQFSKDILEEKYFTLSFDENLKKTVWKPIKRIFKRQTNEILILKTDKGRTLQVTPDHLVLVCDENSSLQTKRAKDLKQGEQIPFISNLPRPLDSVEELDLIELLGSYRNDIWVSYEMPLAFTPTLKVEMMPLVTTAYARHNYRKSGHYPLKVYLELEKKFSLDRRKAKLLLRSGKANLIPAVIDLDGNFARLLGYYLAEGCTSKNGTTDKIVWVFGNNENEVEYVNDLCAILDSYEIRYSIRDGENTKSVWVSSWFLGKLFRNVLKIGSNAHQKQIPTLLQNQPIEIIEELLKGLLRGDGSIVFYPHKGSKMRMCWATVSRKLFEQVLFQLHTIKIFPSTYIKPERDTVIQGRIYHCQIAYFLEFCDYKSMQRIRDYFSTFINERIERELEKYQGTMHSFPRHKKKDGFAVLSAKDIERKEIAISVYDIEVEDTHNFVTSGGIITHNCFGVPTVGGEVVFDDAYSLNPLVNAFALGIVRHDQIFFGKASGIGNPILYVGAKTGRDGIHGATMASAEFDDEALEKRPTVQVGDPFLEKLLLEACLEAMRSGAIAGIQDMGAAGLTSSSCEMAARAGTGIEIDLTLVPQRETNMTAYEMLLSESQERMLIVAKKGHEREVIETFNKWDLDAVVIGRVVEGHNMRVIHNDEIVADIPVAALTDEAPRYERKQLAVKSSRQSAVSSQQSAVGNPQSAIRNPQSKDFNQDLIALLTSPNICSKEWVYHQYDYMVRTNTAVLPGADAAVIRIKETRRAIAMCLDGNGRYCAVNPREGAKQAVAEAARNVVCVGAKPIAITNCLNFASPERPEVMWSFSEVIDGMAEACAAFETPVVSGNVSFYNETEGRGILPTPVIGMVGLIEDTKRIITQGFKNEGDIIALLGETKDDLSVSEYASIIENKTTDEIIANGILPMIDLEKEKALQAACLLAAEIGLLNSAHDCSDGGLAVALAECCFSSLNRKAIGTSIELNEELNTTAKLFSETPSRIVVSFNENALEQLKEIASQSDCAFTAIGRVGGDTLEIKSNGEEVISISIDELEKAWRSSLELNLKSEAIATHS